MKIFLLTLLIGVSYCDRLENTYLPPTSSRTAGGSGNFLSAPKQSFSGSSFPGSTGFAAKSYSAPANTYGVPSASFKSQPQIPILKYNNENQDGQYRYEYETGNGIMAHEQGHQKEENLQEVHGSYSYTAPEGHQITVDYIANENGYQATGDHLPVSPPIPDAILKSLQLNAEAEARGIFDDGTYRSSNEGAYRSSNEGSYPSSNNAGYGSSNNGGFASSNIGAHRSSNVGSYSTSQGFQGQSRQYLAPAVVSKHILAPKVNNQYLAPSFAAKQFSGAPKISNQYLAPGFGAKQFSVSSKNNQYLAPRKPSFSANTGYHY